MARGSGTGLSGGALPLAEGVLIVLARMRRIAQVDLDNQRVVVQPGVTNLAVSRAVGPTHFYPPDPSSQIVCSIGGNIAENSGGAHCFKYGFTTNYVLGLQVVLSDGTLTRLRRDDPGYRLDAGAALVVEVDGPREECEGVVAALEQMCEHAGAFDVRLARSDAERDLIWRPRKAAFAAMGRIAPAYYVQDGVIARTRLAEVLRQIDALASEYRLRVANVFHAGDGNLHPLGSGSCAGGCRRARPRCCATARRALEPDRGSVGHDARGAVRVDARAQGALRPERDLQPRRFRGLHLMAGPAPMHRSDRP